MTSVTEEGLYMELNASLIVAARSHAQTVESSGMTLPAEIPGFPKLFIAKTDDPTIAAISAIKSESGTSYKVGTRKDAEVAHS
ncbi:MAG: hypothetical protein Athens041674_452 [Parcubacteria group bacterium Athens0416_74]|nr:MAG: hypothetical protein Athens041674_452 [Parcubacteria group bacterium Athens0416_74]